MALARYERLREDFWTKYGSYYEKDITNQYLKERDNFRTALQEAMPTVLWQVIASYLTLKERCRLSRCDKHMNEEVIFGPDAECWVWSDVKLFDTTNFYFMEAIRNNYIKLLKIILKTKVSLPKHVFHICYNPRAVNYSTELFKMLVDAKADINYKHFNGESVLKSVLDSCEKVKILIEAKVDINDTNNNNETALISLCRLDGRTDVLNLLLDSNANVNIIDSLNMSALCYAVQFEQILFVKLLLEKGANVNVNIGVHPTKIPLYLAWRQINYPIMKMLLKHGANPNFSVYDEDFVNLQKNWKMKKLIKKFM